MGKFIDEKALSEYLGVSRRAIQKWRLFGRGPRYRKFSGAVRYDVADVDAWVKSCPAGGGGR